jgi:HlyD family secretion protein
VEYKFLSEEKKDGHTTIQAPLDTPEDFELDSHPIQEAETLDDFDLDSVSIADARESQRPWFVGVRGILLGMAIGIVLAVVGMRLLSKPATAPKAESTATTSTSPTELPPQMSVTVAPVETTSVSSTLEVTGTVAAKDLLPVLPQASGLQIKEVAVAEGQSVQVGQIMAVLDNSVLQTQISQAQAQLEAAQSRVRQQQAALGQAQAALGQAQATVAQNKANLAQTERTFQRYKQLADQKAISTQDLDIRQTAVTTAAEAVRVAEANVRSAQAAISSAQANVSSAEADVRNNLARVQQSKTQLGQTQVLAPKSGVVVAPNAEGRCDWNATSGSPPQAIARVGDTSGNKALFCIIHNGLLELQAKVPEIQLSQVRIGAPVIVTSNADSRIRLQGTVQNIVPVVDQQTRDAMVKIELPSSSLLRPGMFLKAAITTQTSQGLTIPAKAVMPQADGKAIVYLLDANDIAHVQSVEVGTTSAGNKGDLSTAKVEIKSGLKEGDRVIVKGAGYLKDGDKVLVVSGQ